MQSRLRGGAATLASLGIILAGMTIMNDRVRDQVHALVAGHGPSHEVTSSAHQVQSAAWLAVDLRDRIAELDINPLRVLPRGKGARVVDALVVLK